MSYGVRKVPDGVSKVSYGVRKVAYAIRKVSDGVKTLLFRVLLQIVIKKLIL